MSIPLIYISGKYRHWLASGHWDHEKMAAEEKAEERWGRIILLTGAMPFGPIRNSSYLQGAIPDAEFIERDLEIIGCFRPGLDMILMRPGWKTSEGAQRELAKAQECGLEVLYGIQGAEVVAEYLSAKVEGRLEELADALDVAEAEKRLGEPTVPFEQVKADLGL